MQPKAASAKCCQRLIDRANSNFYHNITCVAALAKGILVLVQWRLRSKASEERFRAPRRLLGHTGTVGPHGALGGDRGWISSTPAPGKTESNAVAVFALALLLSAT